MTLTDSSTPLMKKPGSTLTAKALSFFIVKRTPWYAAIPSPIFLSFFFIFFILAPLLEVSVLNLALWTVRRSWMSRGILSDETCYNK